MPLRIAHRGMPRLSRENTLPSFVLAMEAAADGIELDVHVTADGMVVVHHDEQLADGSSIAELDYADLQRREAAPGVPIPTLAEVCTLVAGRAALFVELKGRGIETAVATALARYSGDVAIHSFDHAMIARLNARGCRWPLGILFEGGVADLPQAMATTGALDVWPQFPFVSGALVTTVHDRGGRVIPWTVNSVSEARHLTALGVDGLCGDDISLFDH